MTYPTPGKCYIPQNAGTNFVEGVNQFTRKGPFKLNKYVQIVQSKEQAMANLTFSGKRENRYQILWVTPEQILNVMAGLRTHDYLYIPILRGLPDDVEVEDVKEDWQRKMFGFRLWSATFPIVPEGMMFPDYQGPFDMVEHESISTKEVPGLAVRKLKPKKDDLIVLRHPDNAKAHYETVAAMEAFKGTYPETHFLTMPEGFDIHQFSAGPQDVLVVKGSMATLEMARRTVTELNTLAAIIFLPEDATVEQTDEAEMRRAGWMRIVGDKAAPDSDVGKERQRLLSRLEDAKRSWDKEPDEKVRDAVRSAFDSFACCLTHAGVTVEEAVAAARAKMQSLYLPVPEQCCRCENPIGALEKMEHDGRLFCAMCYHKTISAILKTKAEQDAGPAERMESSQIMTLNGLREYMDQTMQKERQAELQEIHRANATTVAENPEGSGNIPPSPEAKCGHCGAALSDPPMCCQKAMRDFGEELEAERLELYKQKTEGDAMMDFFKGK